MKGVVVNIIPEWGRLRVILDSGKEASLHTTYPFYSTKVYPSIYSNPDVDSVEEEKWDSFDGEVTLFRIESFNPRLKVREKYSVNTFPPSWVQAYVRKGISPFRIVEISGDKVKDLGEGFYDVTTLEVKRSPFSKTKMFLNGEEVEGLDDVRVDVALAPSWFRVKSLVWVNPDEVRINVGLRGLMEWSLISKMPLSVVARYSIGKVLTTNEAWVALKRKFIVPKVRANVERQRTLKEIMEADKGGLILFPRAGIYEDVVQLDFNSMYPSIIVRNNISAETVNVNCEKDVIKTEIGHTICSERTGIVPEALKYLIKRKEEMRGIDRERMEAIKWVLVASFGYLGYRNSRFGKIEAYELVTYFARKIMRDSIEIARSLGLDVLHGLIDSLIVKGRAERISSFMTKLEEKTGIKVKIDSEFHWICFTNSRKGEPYPQRYFGRTKDGIKVKGVIRRNQPKMIQDFLAEVIRTASKEKRADEVKRAVLDSLPQITEKYLLKARFGVPSDYVLIVKGRPIIRGSKFYVATKFMGHDPSYYEEYVKRTAIEVKRWFS